MITREQAKRIATDYLEAAFTSRARVVSERVRHSHEPTIEAVRDVSDVGRPPMPYLASTTTRLADCWIAYLTSRHLALQPSQIVLVSKETGDVVYFGSANDEG